MSINFPGTIDVFVNPSGTSTLNDPDHSLQHSDANDAIEAIEAVIGTTAGTSVLKDFSAGEFAVRQEGGTVSPGTLTFDSPTLGTPAITGGTATGLTLAGTPVLDATSAIPFYGDSIHRQAIINGNFDVWQRGTSLALADNTSSFLADRWVDYQNKDGGTLPTLTRSREILTSGDIPNTFYYSRLTTNGAGTSLGANSRHLYQENIENGTRFLCGDGKKITVSFWARSSIANKKIGLYSAQNYGTGGSPSTAETIVGTTFNLTSSWVKYTAIITTNTLVGKTFGTANDDMFNLFFMYMWGTDRAGRVNAGTTAETYVGSGYIDIAQVQLCAGDVALPFMPKSYAEELKDCQRFYETGEFTLQTYSNNASQYAGKVTFKVTKRVAPTISQTNVGNSGFGTTPGNVNNNVDGFESQRTATSTAASSYWSESWTADAEL